jgi:hypothetical protein
MPFLIALALIAMAVAPALITLDTIRVARRMGGVPYDVRYSALGA